MNRRAPVGGPASPDANLRVGIGIIVVMLIVGFLILRTFGDGQRTNLATSTGDSDPTNPTTPGSSSSLAPTTSSTIPLKDPTTIKMLVVNGTSTDGAADKVADAVRPAGYNLLSAVDASAAYKKTQAANTTEVLVQNSFEREATLLANQLGIPASALSAFPPDPKSFPFMATTATMTANIILVIGADLATKPPPALPANPAASSTSSSSTTVDRQSGTTRTTRRATTTTRRSTSSTTVQASTTTTTAGGN